MTGTIDAVIMITERHRIGSQRDTRSAAQQVCRSSDYDSHR